MPPSAPVAHPAWTPQAVCLPDTGVLCWTVASSGQGWTAASVSLAISQFLMARARTAAWQDHAKPACPGHRTDAGAGCCPCPSFLWLRWALKGRALLFPQRSPQCPGRPASTGHPTQGCLIPEPHPQPFSFGDSLAKLPRLASNSRASCCSLQHSWNYRGSTVRGPAPGCPLVRGGHGWDSRRHLGIYCFLDPRALEHPPPVQGTVGPGGSGGQGSRAGDG